MAVDIFKYFFKHPKFNKLIGNDYMFVEYKCPLEVENFKLWTDTPFINFVISGNKDWTALDKTYKIKEGEALFINKGVYNTKQYVESEYCVMLFFITEDFIRRFIKEHKDILKQRKAEVESKQIFNIEVSDSLNTLFLSVFNYLNQNEKVPKELIEMKFKELLFNISLNPQNSQLLNFFYSLQQIEKSNLNTVMMKNFHCDIKLEEFARLSGRSLSTFKRDFQNHFKKTPGKWLNNKRLEYAKSLLENPELNINDICFESGFKNASHFNSSFKERCELPPNQYRKQHLGQ